MSLDLAWILVYEVLLDTDDCMERKSVRLTRLMETLVAARNVRPCKAQGDTSSWSADTGLWSIWTLTRSVRLYERRGRHWPVVRPQRLASLRRTPSPPLRTPHLALRVNTGFSFPYNTVSAFLLFSEPWVVVSLGLLETRFSSDPIQC